MSSIPRVSMHLLSLILLSFFPVLMMSAVVTLDSIKIYKTHEWFKQKPTVYFSCIGENKTIILPDVKDVNVSYSFNGQESWQPLTEFSSEKCKRCGFYEKDILDSDDVFEEWEFCPSQFEDSNGLYKRVKEHEFDATFQCPECLALKAADSNGAPVPRKKGNGMHVALVIGICMLVSVVVAFTILAAYKYWQRKKREQDQARFLKLFEEGDDLEDELGLGNVL